MFGVRRSFVVPMFACGISSISTVQSEMLRLHFDHLQWCLRRPDALMFKHPHSKAMSMRWLASLVCMASMLTQCILWRKINGKRSDWFSAKFQPCRNIIACCKCSPKEFLLQLCCHLVYSIQLWKNYCCCRESHEHLTKRLSEYYWFGPMKSADWRL